jgi:phospholipid/cholesterol/gamma-HCH transport system ATP-binding protein
VIRFEGVTDGRFRDLSFEVRPGAVCVITTESEFDTAHLARLLLGIVRPKEGKVFLFGEDLAPLPEEEVTRLCRNVGVVWNSGGLISNLKAWENAVLPLWYHQGRQFPETEERLLGFLSRLGIEEEEIDDFSKSTVSSLSAHQRRVLSLARAMLMEPDLMIYESSFKGLSQEKRESFALFARSFHDEKPGRTSVFITADFHSLGSIRANMIVNADEGSERK